MPSILALSAAAALADPIAAVPMVPTGRWTVDYGDTACTLGRVFGAGKDETVVTLRRMPLESSLELAISKKDGNRAFRVGKAIVAIDGGGSDDSGYQSYPTRTPGMRITRVQVNGALFDALPANAVLRVAPDKMKDQAFALPGGKAAFEALAKCNDATLAKWGLDPAERTRIATPAKADTNPGDWIRSDDYPAEVASKGAQGITVIMWAIGIDGRVHDCRPVASSGEPALDKAACQALAKRARYIPARGADGTPMVSHSTRSVMWRMPGWSGKD